MFGVRDDYRRFFVRPFPVAACYLGRYFFTAALLAAAVYAAAFYRDVLGYSGQTFCFTAAVAAVGGIAARCIRTASSGAVRTAAAAGSVTAIAATAVVLLLPLFVSASVFVYAGFAAAFAAGVGYGLISDAQKGYLKAALALTGASRGTHKCMTGMLTCGAARYGRGRGRDHGLDIPCFRRLPPGGRGVSGGAGGVPRARRAVLRQGAGGGAPVRTAGAGRGGCICLNS